MQILEAREEWFRRRSIWEQEGGKEAELTAAILQKLSHSSEKNPWLSLEMDKLVWKRTKVGKDMSSNAGWIDVWSEGIEIWRQKEEDDEEEDEGDDEMNGTNQNGRCGVKIAKIGKGEIEEWEVCILSNQL
jgi:hypothetical protein